ncbi:hypothetical protein ACWENQ_21495 [Nonomuraea sp. NPDC004354]
MTRKAPGGGLAAGSTLGPHSAEALERRIAEPAETRAGVLTAVDGSAGLGVGMARWRRERGRAWALRGRGDGGGRRGGRRGWRA